MRTFRIAASILLCMAILPSVQAQRNANPDTYYRAPSSVHGKTVLIPVGTTLEGRIDSSIGSSISAQGQAFTITIASPVLANGVDVIIPSGSQMLGEVVEAIPSNRLPHEKGMPKPKGKLRVTISGLRTPDGQTYPMVASITGETITMGRKTMANPNLGGGYGYMGSTAGFEAVAPGMQDKMRRQGRGPMVMGRDQMMRDPIYGMDRGNAMARMGTPTIRSLVLRGTDVFIDAGSPLNVKLNAPFKIAFNPPGAAGAPMDSLDEDFDNPEGRRFEKTGSRATRERVNPVSSDPNDPLGIQGNSGGSSAPPAPPPPPTDSAPPGNDF